MTKGAPRTCSIHHQRSTLRNRRGFTLIEVLLAMTIGSLLVVSLVSSTRAVTRARESIDARAERVAEARRAMDAIVAALRNVRRDPEQKTPLIAGHGGGPGGSDQIDMLVISGAIVRPDSPESDQQEVGFYLQTVGKDRLTSLMCRRDHAFDDHPDEGGVATMIAKCIVGLNFEYYSPTGEWQRQWATTEPQPPQTVRVTLTAATEPRRGERPAPESVTLSAAVAIKVSQPTPPADQQNRSERGGGSR